MTTPPGIGGRDFHARPAPEEEQRCDPPVAAPPAMVVPAVEPTDISAATSKSNAPATVSCLTLPLESECQLHPQTSGQGMPWDHGLTRQVN
ncbi:hypothetical protein KTU01_23540 [Kocuria turfanensis]|uniref:Uncharacterized protein n=1 Tax=Kocuria turfanensis TaxID=388357 RepID=A0A512IEV8_9MICC|nr:hypothetical protein KTU01_23540 [Kocuria turfanensis]